MEFIKKLCESINNCKNNRRTQENSPVRPFNQENIHTPQFSHVVIQEKSQNNTQCNKRNLSRSSSSIIPSLIAPNRPEAPSLSIYEVSFHTRDATSVSSLSASSSSTIPPLIAPNRPETPPLPPPVQPQRVELPKPTSRKKPDRLNKRKNSKPVTQEQITKLRDDFSKLEVKF